MLVGGHRLTMRLPHRYVYGYFGFGDFRFYVYRDSHHPLRVSFVGDEGGFYTLISVCVVSRSTGVVRGDFAKRSGTDCVPVS